MLTDILLMVMLLLARLAEKHIWTEEEISKRNRENAIEKSCVMVKSGTESRTKKRYMLMTVNIKKEIM